MSNKKNINYKKIIKKIVIITLIIIVSFYILLLIFARKIETSMTFPGAEIGNVQDLVGRVPTDLKFNEINIKDKNGNNINGLYVWNNKPKTIYYFHGNGGPLDYAFNEIKYLSDLGYNVIAYDYPGYGKSTSSPSENTTKRASEIFYNFMKKEKKLQDKNVIVWGSSIGTAIAINFANNHKNIDKIVLVSPPSSRYDMGKYIFGFALQKYLFVKNSFISAESVKGFSFPVLIIHGNNDKTIPIWQAKKIYKNYLNADKFFIEIDGIGHNFIIDVYGKSLKNIIEKYLKGEDLNFENNYFFLGASEKTRLEKENEEIEKKRKFLKNLDLKTDSSLQKFVSAKVSFNDKAYIPEDLEKIASEYVLDSKGGQKMRKAANEALQKMAKDFYEEFNTKMVNVSAYRSYQTQVGIKARGCPDKFCSKAGFSEHQSGLAIDFFEATTQKHFLANSNYKKYFEWMKKNAYKYGFHNTYQRGIEIDTYIVEPWHWRYLGVEFATYLKENDLTIAEFYEKFGGEK